MLSKECACCGKVFFKKQVTSMKEWTEQTKYCSRPCYWKDKRKPPSKTCPSCGQPFKPKDWRTAAKYCSLKCRVDARKKPLPTCELCGETCIRHGRRFCSPGCKVAWYRGDNHVGYVGENFRKGAHPVDYVFWSKRAKEARRRDKVCQHCGKTAKDNGRALDVHHIVPYRVSQDNSLDNLIALCRVCHRIADAEYQANNLT